MSCKSQSVRIALLWSTSARQTHCGDRNRSKKKSVPRNVKRGTFRKLNPPFLPFPLRGGVGSVELLFRPPPRPFSVPSSTVFLLFLRGWLVWPREIKTDLFTQCPPPPFHYRPFPPILPLLRLIRLTYGLGGKGLLTPFLPSSSLLVLSLQSLTIPCSGAIRNYTITS